MGHSVEIASIGWFEVNAAEVMKWKMTMQYKHYSTEGNMKRSTVLQFNLSFFSRDIIDGFVLQAINQM
ncbi:hypothetical protein FKM82_001646 [Ascaphus truei]